MPDGHRDENGNVWVTSTLSPKELTQASNALIDWFESQGIKPGDAEWIMVHTVVSQSLGRYGPDLRKVVSSVNAFTSLAHGCTIDLWLASLLDRS